MYWPFTHSPSIWKGPLPMGARLKAWKSSSVSVHPAGTGAVEGCVVMMGKSAKGCVRFTTKV